MKQKKRNFPSTIVIMFVLIVVVTIFTHIIPAGSFKMAKDPKTGIEKVLPSSFSYEKSAPIDVFNMFVCIHNGFADAADIITMCYFACFYIIVIMETGSLQNIINILLNKTKKNKTLLIPIIMLVISLAGSTYGETEDFYPLIPLFVGVALSAGYDAIIGVCMIGLAVIVGFIAGPINPYNVGLSQNIAGLPMFSGMLFRWIIYFIFMFLAIWWTVRYAKKIEKNPEASFTNELDFSEMKLDEEILNNSKLTPKNIIVLIGFVICIGYMIYGCTKLKWEFNQISALFLLGGVFTGVVWGYKPDKIGEIMVSSIQSIAIVVVIIGLGRSIYVVLHTAKVVDTLIYWMYLSIKILPKSLGVVGMFIVQAIINLFIPGTTGQAAATMPIMIPLADLMGINRQVAVLAFQFGNGFTKLLWPTGSIAIICGLAKVPLDRWYKFFMPLFGMFFALCCVILILAQFINYGPF